mmetsp:Transcript_2375/g.5161  ORF Transcript_2375/g.5161 Transcript_2375/m.5161 type:complete len:266 (+) Transcript_2375:474-1271(+)
MSEVFVRLKPRSTPRLIMSHSTLNGTATEKTVIMAPVRRVPRLRVPFSSVVAKPIGISPSSASAANNSGWGRKLTRTTSGRRATSPTAVTHLAATQPLAPKAASKDVAPPPSEEEARSSPAGSVEKGTMPLNATWAKTESRVAPTRVPAMARGITSAGRSHFPARQHTSSKPMKPKKRREVPVKVPAVPVGKKTSGEASVSTSRAANPAAIMKRTRNTFAAVKPLITTLPIFRPATHTNTQATCSRPAGKSRYRSSPWNKPLGAL